MANNFEQQAVGRVTGDEGCATATAFDSECAVVEPEAAHDGLAGGGVAAEALLDEQGPDIFFKELRAIFLRDEREDGE